MNREQKFFICKHCGNLIGLIDNHGVPVVCCGEIMSELIPNTTEASAEKHLPVVRRECDCGCKCEGCLTVDIGSAPHPSTDEHHIGFVYLQTQKGGQRKELSAGAAPSACFCCCDGDVPVAVFAYCNLHGLWKTDLADRD